MNSINILLVAIAVLCCNKAVYSYNIHSSNTADHSLSKERSHRTGHSINVIESRRSFVAGSIAAISGSSISFPTHAITPQEASKSYDIYATTYDDLDGGTAASALGIDEARTKLLRLARGDVLEIGVGTGLNLSSYKLNRGQEDGITSLTLVDISQGMLSQAKLRVEQLELEKSITVKIIQADATSQLIELFGKNKFDTVVDTFSLCVMGNEGAENCLREMAGVVKGTQEGGKVLLIENTRSSNPFLGVYQDITATSAADLGGKGCLYNQDVGKMIQNTRGLRMLREEDYAAGLFRSFVCEQIT